MEIFLTHLSDISAQSLTDYTCCLDTAELNRLACISDPRRRTEFITGRALVRDTLSHITGLQSHHIHLTALPNGTPVIRGIDGLYFSLSHTQDTLVLAIDSSPVGIDIEHIKPHNFLALIQRTFSPENKDFFKILRPDEQSDFFFRSWTMKEAGYKLAHQPDADTYCANTTDFQKIHFASGQWDNNYIALASFEPIQETHIQHKQPLQDITHTTPIDNLIIT